MNYNQYRLSGGFALANNEIVNANSMDEFLEWYRYTRNLSGDLPFFINTSGFSYTFHTDEIVPKQIGDIAFNKSTKKEMADTLDKYFNLEEINMKKIHEKIRREYIDNKKKFIYDEMEDNSGMNNIEECTGMASLGASPTPAAGHVSAATVNGQAVPSKSIKRKKKKSIKELTEELNKVMSESDYDNWLYAQADEYNDPHMSDLTLSGLSYFDIVVLEDGQEKTYQNIPLYYYKNIDLSDYFDSSPRWSDIESDLDYYMDFDNKYFEEYDDPDDPDYPLPPNYNLVKVLGFSEGHDINELLE